MTPDVRAHVSATDDFRALFDASFGDIWRFVRRRCATAEDADDVIAQVFTIAWRRWAEVPAGEDARLWLFGVARRVLANQRRGAVRLERLRQRLAAVASAFRTGDPAVGSNRHEALREAIAQLGDADRMVVTMRYWDDLSLAEIAAVLGTTPNGVSIRLHRARKRLADHIGARPGAKDAAATGHVVVDGPRREGAGQ